MRFKTLFNRFRHKKLYSIFPLFLAFFLCVLLLETTIYKRVEKEMQYYSSIGRLEDMTRFEVVKLRVERLKNAILLQTKSGRDAYRAHYGADPPPPGYRHEQYEGGVVRLVPLINPRPDIQMRSGFAPNPEQLAGYQALKKKFLKLKSVSDDLMILNTEPDDAKLSQHLNAMIAFEKVEYGKARFDFTSRKGLIAKMKELADEMKAIETEIDELVAVAQGEVPVVTGYTFIYEGSNKTQTEKKQLLQRGLKSQAYQDVIDKAYRDAGLPHLIGIRGITGSDTVSMVQPVQPTPQVNPTVPDK